MITIGTYLFELGILALIKSAGMNEPPDILILLLILIFTGAFAITVSQKTEYACVGTPLICGLLFRVALVIWDIYGRGIYLLPNSGADTESFYWSAVAIANGAESSRHYFSIVVGTFFKYFGISRLSGQFLIALFSIVSLMYAAKMLELLNIDLRTRRKTMWILCMLPNFAILSSIFLRESIVAMFITLSLYAYLKWVKRGSELSFVLAIAFSFAGARFHSGAIAAAVGYMLSRLLYDRRTGTLHLSFRNLFVTVVLLLAATFVLNNYGDSFLGKFSGVESLEDVANENDMGGSSYARFVGNSNNPINMIIFTIPRMAFFLFSPMPWMIRGISGIIAFLFSSCYYLVVLLSVLKYLKRKGQPNRDLTLTIFIVAMCAAFVFGWGVSNAGTACRHRDKMTVVWGILYALVNMQMYKTPKPKSISSASKTIQ